ncbi:hypothetical protein ACJW30_06G192700, partial [Castanea mollissima]
ISQNAPTWEKNPAIFSRAGKLGNRLGSFGDGVLGELAGEDQPHRRLDFARGDGRLLVVAGEPGGLARELLEDVVDEAVHDSHGLAGNPNVGVDLLQHLEDVHLVGLHVALRPLLLLVDRGGGAALLRELLLRLRLLLCRCFLRRLLLRCL